MTRREPYWEVLGVTDDPGRLTREEVRAAYRQRVAECSDKKLRAVIERALREAEALLERMGR